MASNPVRSKLFYIKKLKLRIFQYYRTINYLVLSRWTKFVKSLIRKHITESISILRKAEYIITEHSLFIRFFRNSWRVKIEKQDFNESSVIWSNFPNFAELVSSKVSNWLWILDKFSSFWCFKLWSSKGH